MSEGTDYESEQSDDVIDRHEKRTIKYKRRRKHKSPSDVEEISRDTSDPSEVIEIHGSSSEEGEVSSSGTSSESSEDDSDDSPDSDDSDHESNHRKISVGDDRNITVHIGGRKDKQERTKKCKHKKRHESKLLDEGGTKQNSTRYESFEAKIQARIKEERRTDSHDHRSKNDYSNRNRRKDDDNEKIKYKERRDDRKHGTSRNDRKDCDDRDRRKRDEYIGQKKDREGSPKIKEKRLNGRKDDVQKDQSKVDRHKSIKRDDRDRHNKRRSPSELKTSQIKVERESREVERTENDRSRHRSRESGHSERTKKDVNVKRERDSKERVDHRSSNSNRQNNRNVASTSRGIKRRLSEENDNYEWGQKQQNVKSEPQDKQKPNFELSGKLTEDRNMFNGVVIKYSEPPEARMPKKRWRLYPFKGEEALQALYIHRQSAYLIGRDRKVADLPVYHPSCSKQHAALQYRLVTLERPNGTLSKQIRLYIIDLESANGTYINNKKIDPRKYVELMEKDVIKFGYSSREYVLLHEGSKGDSDDEG